MVLNATPSPSSPAAARDPRAPRYPALFKSVRAALAFAYAMAEHGIAAQVSWPGPRRAGNSRLLGLTAHDKHAQSALIRRAVEERLRGLDLALTLAYYGSGPTRDAAVKVVCKKVAKLIRRPGLGRALAQRHFSRNGVRVSQAQLGLQYGLSQQTISRLDREVADEIDRLRVLAERRLEHVFIATGVADAL